MGRGRRVSTTLSEINVVPLVDVMLVLLIIFMVTAPMLQRGIDVKLPVQRRAAAVEGARVSVTIPLSYRTDQTLYIDDEPVRSGVFAERVRQKMEGRTDKQVYLRGDRGILYQELMDVVARLRDAGVDNVGLLATEQER
jgi:biopolymer transport protein TolR